MSQGSQLLCGCILSCLGWVGLIVATATNDWVMTCSHGFITCSKVEEQESKGLWIQCVMAESMYQCSRRNRIITLPAYLQVCRALMVSASLLGLPSILLTILSMPCIKLDDESDETKRKRALFGGILTLLMFVCGMVSTVWFPIGAHHDEGLMSFGLSLYIGWVGAALCLLGGLILTCSSRSDSPVYQPEKRFYYSKQFSVADSVQATNSHAKSAHV